MLLRLERVEAQHDVTVLDATETFVISKDVDEPDRDGTNPIMTTNDGTAFISLVPRGSCTAG
ncbi:hypothetical protein GCM10010172_31270 [Paractinoplanes ferrugineus]|uniref:Uncharacterized protein n=1 Tax=Paractinoplanes ferrugineus TaxID=113564 RepID=A0A919JBN1_9ACTN|nr:hypothetical protein [Actinoplanes ferrugineus]GIE14181.1 hypothetical protein Afe05nite_60210 [Actinoplanes ferrugineus]